MGRKKIIKEPNYKCSQCGKLFFRFPSTVRNENAVFCCKKCHNEYMKTSMLGENNPNYKHNWDDDLRKKVSYIVKQRYLKNPELKKLCAFNKGKKLLKTSEKLKEYYKTHSSHNKGRTLSLESRIKIGEKSKQKFTDDYKEKMRKRYEELGYWIPLKNKKDIEIYYKESNWKQNMFNLIDDEKQLKLLKEYRVFNATKNPNGVVRDHMYSRRSGFENGVFPEILRHPCNCQILTSRDNLMKKRQRYIDGDHLTLDELFARIINYKKKWYEQDLVIKLIEDYKNGKRWINKYRKE